MFVRNSQFLTSLSRSINWKAKKEQLIVRVTQQSKNKEYDHWTTSKADIVTPLDIIKKFEGANLNLFLQTVVYGENIILPA